MAVTQRVVNANGKEVKAKICSATILTAADVDKIVTTANMKVGSYTVAAQPSCPSLITVSATAAGTADTMGTITVTGTDIFGNTISDVIVPVAGSTVSGVKYFKTVTSVVGAGWVIDAGAGNDTITVGVPQSGGIDAGGLRVTLINEAGNIYWNDTATAVADTTSMKMIAGDQIEHLLVPGGKPLSIIADNSGGTFSAIVWKP